MEHQDQQAQPVSPRGAQHTVTRRTLLGASVAGAAGVALAPAAQAQPSPAPRGASAKFAMIADTHANVTNTGRTSDLVRTMADIEARDPDFVLHCGDITEWGSQDEVDLYLSSIPSGLASRIHHVPGNHETQWNADAWEGYRRAFGPTHYSFDAAGLHVVGMDPLVSQQWPSYQFGRRLLEEVSADLASVPEGVPIVMVSHFPLSDDWLFVNNADELWRIIEPYPVRLMFSGHIHRREVSQFNGVTHLVGNALLKAPVYYWAEQVSGEDGDQLAISEVRVPASGESVEELIAYAPLGPVGPGETFGPLKLSVSGGREEITVKAVAVPRGGRPRSQWPSTIKARVYPQGIEPPAWTTLERRGRSPVWAGALAAAALPPGSHRVQVQASDGGAGPVWSQTAPVSIAPTSAEVAWSHSLAGGTVMAGLAQVDATVVAATTTGVVEALSVDAGGASTEWRAELGGVFKAPVAMPDGETVLVGSADHHLYALEAATGQVQWQRDLGAPVQCEIAVLDTGDSPRIGVAAGTRFFMLDADGLPVWDADLGGTFTGCACTDGHLVFAGSSDGQVHALDLSTGDQAWSTMIATKTDSPYHLTIYGPWAAWMQMLSTGDVLVPAHTAVAALRADTGEVRWAVDGLHRALFTRPVVSDFGVLVFDGKEGDALLLDQATGETTWHDNTLPFVPGSSASWGSAPVPTGNPAIYWMVATTGMLARIDLSAPSITRLLKVSNTFTTSTPALIVGDQDPFLVSIDQMGTVRGITGLNDD